MIKIVTAQERLKVLKRINIAMFGPSGVGKTTQLRTLDPKTTLCLDLEAGMLAVQDWKGDSIDIKKMAQDLKIHPWLIARAIACVITGPDYSAPADGAYSQAAYDHYIKHIITPEALEKYDTIFVDSITVASRFAFAWSKTQPEAFSDKTGKPDNRGAYGLLGQEMISWLTVLQHSPKSIVVVGILEEEKDEFKRVSWQPQIEGGKTGKELPGIFDEIITLQNLQTSDKQNYRAFICTSPNDWGFPAKDRSSCLDMQEPPDLGALIKKIRAGVRKDETIVTTIPEVKPVETPTTPTQGTP